MLFIITAQLSFAGAWVQNKGSGLNIATIQYYNSTHYWTGSGVLQDVPLYEKLYGSNYFEYGLTKDFTVGFYLSALQSHTRSTRTAGGGNDNMILGRLLLWKNDKFVLSTQFFYDGLGHGTRVNIPPQNTKKNTGEAILFGTSGTLGKNNGVSWFADASVGILQRYGPGNQVEIIFENGWKFYSDKFWFFFQSFNTISTTQTSHPQGFAYNLYTLAPSILYWPTKTMSVQIGVTQDIYGQNVGKGIGPFIASWITF